MALAEKNCQSCAQATKPLTRQKFEPLLSELAGWQVEDNRLLRKVIKLSNFAQALSLANKIGDLAEEQGHHPDLLVRWGELVIDLFTHKVNGLTEADFIMAARCDRLLADIASGEIAGLCLDSA